MPASGTGSIEQRMTVATRTAHDQSLAAPSPRSGLPDRLVGA
jgi:hypothetical protein